MPSYAQDFREIAHCGGQVAIRIVMDASGQRKVSFNFRHSRPGPAIASGVYALPPHGTAEGEFGIGSSGGGLTPPPPPHCIAIFLASDSEGKYGRKCPACELLFRNQTRSPAGLCCPYCGHVAQSFKFLTSAQSRFVKHCTEVFMNEYEKDIEPGSQRERIIDMDAIVDAIPHTDPPPFYYSSEAQQTIFTCDKCGQFNDIRGLYGYCSVCWTRNNLSSLKKELEKVRLDLNDRTTSEISAVKTSVSAFDACCRDFVGQLTKRIPMRQSRREEFSRLKFHDINNSSFNRIKPIFDIDILRGISQENIDFIKLMLHRRHVYEHNGGVADHRYISKSGDKSTAEGTLIRESQENANRLIGHLLQMVTNFQSDFHELFPVNREQIRAYDEDQRWLRACKRD